MSTRLPVIFDLDGTLISSAPDIREGLNAALEEVGAGPLDLPTVVSFIGWGLPRLVEQAADHLRLDRAGLPALTDRTMHHYKALSGSRTALFPGVAEVLAELAGAGHPLALCTNKPAAATIEVLAHLGLSETFASVVCGDSLLTRKPDPEMLRLSLSELGAGHAVYVGDSEIDAETAERAGLPFALFTEGYRHCAVEEMTHAAAFDDFAALPGIVAQLAG
ncbi:phosphoglycolate phosphatase [Pseudooceanicola nanhaiensis]|uniref:phosphoglycolate phosphatase n=1 Tax=Pseudooceanicola nanhaiensis TaxID=375761 RepID=UPI001CD70BBE|nr:phosphoglycolate phosphatase [Pseudooceanicola nanhaiensis]MCA0920554.1 phosphoglycolate phosphatase [Pseudooceanicola nanhaiensis]